jgi:plastocyanin
MDHYLKADKDSDILSVTINCPQQNGTYSYKCKLQARYRYGAWERGLKRGETGATLIEYQEVEDHTETTLTVKVLDNVPDIPHLGGDKEYLVAVMSAMPSNTSVTVRPAESELPGDGIPIYAWADTPVTVTLSAKYAYAEEDDFCKNTWSFALKITNSDGTAIKDLAKPKEDNRRITDKAQPFENQRGSGTLKVAFVTPSTTGEYEYKCSCSAKFTSGGWILSWKDTYSDARDITIKVCVEDKNL